DIYYICYSRTTMEEGDTSCHPTSEGLHSHMYTLETQGLDKYLGLQDRRLSAVQISLPPQNTWGTAARKEIHSYSQIFGSQQNIGKIARSDISSQLCGNQLHNGDELPEDYGSLNSLHICSVCGYRAKSQSLLQIHFRKHTGEKPHQCSYCEFSSAQGCNLKRHIRRHHMGTENISLTSVLSPQLSQRNTITMQLHPEQTEETNEEQIYIDL
ncbi:unnamed protein product, partial [Meganyctiphanes norvegica]